MNEQNEITPEHNSDYTASYSPDDDKIRLKCMYRLDKDLYTRVKSAGFRWAPKQDLFFAFWKPAAEDIALELAGYIGDDDSSLAARAEIRADRFDGYREKRANESQQAYEAAGKIAENIPFGQPILVGHHSEKRARKDQERIENFSRKSISLWETSEYWTRRAQGAIRAAKYKERPDVRARRIKKLEAEIRKWKGYYTPNPKVKPIEYNEKIQVWCGDGRGGRWVNQDSLKGIESTYTRWIAHNENRLVYEKAMLDDQGASDLLKPAPRPKQPPLLNYRCPEGLDIENEYSRGSFNHYPFVETTKAHYARIPNDYKGGKKYNGHRVRVASASYFNDLPEGTSRWGYCIVFLTDSKEHARPEE